MASDAPTAGTPIIPVAIYTRVSTENQVGGRFDSCESQLAVCREHIQRNAHLGWIETAHHSDPAFSGSTMNRPGLRALFSEIESGRIKIVLIFKLERMSRNIDEWGPFRNFLRQHGCRLESATEDISEHTPSGRLKNNLMLSFSQYERENTAEKTRVKMVQQAARGYWNGGALPFGYAYDKNTQSLLPDPAEAPIVRRIFQEAAKLRTLEDIADELNAEGLRTRLRIHRRVDGSEHTVGGLRFRSDGLRLMVINPLYRGTIRYAGQEHSGRHAALVTPELWDEANAAVAKTTRPAQVPRLDQDKHFHLLKGLVHCGCCDRALVPHASGNRDETGNLYRYYCCNALIKERNDSRCTVRRIAAGSLEKVVVRFISELSRHPDIVSTAIASSRCRRHTDRERAAKNLAQAERDLAKTSERIRNCVEAIAAGGKRIAEELADEIARLKDRKQEQTVARQRCAHELAVCNSEMLDSQRVIGAMERFGHVLRGLTPPEQKTLVSLFVERIVIRAVTEAVPPSAADSIRFFDLEFKINLPRLLEGASDGVSAPQRDRPVGAHRTMLTARVALGQQGSATEASIITPFEWSDPSARQKSAPTPEPPATARHPILKALEWRSMLDREPALSLRGLAERLGEVPPTLVRYFKLLKLAPEIQKELRNLTDPLAIHHFSLRRMMLIADLPVAQQRQQFLRLQTARMSSSRTSSRIVNRSSSVRMPIRI